MDKKTVELIDDFRRSRQGVAFADLERVCRALFGDPRPGRGSHIAIFKTGLKHPNALVNIQKDGKNAKSYQIEQVLKIIDMLHPDLSADGADAHVEASPVVRPKKKPPKRV